MTNGILIIILSFLVPTALLLMGLKATGTFDEFRRMHLVKKIATFVIMWCLSLYAYDKPEPPKFNQVLTIKGPTVESATFADLSNRFIYWLKSLGRNSVNTALMRLNEPLNPFVDNGLSNIVSCADTIYSNEIDRTYIDINIPFGVPDNVPQNITATVLHEEKIVIGDKNYKDILVWFSRTPVTNVNLYADMWINESEFIPLNVVSNFWPETEEYNGVDVTRYRVEIPEVNKKLITRNQITLGSDSGSLFSVKDLVLEKDNEFWYTFSGVLELNIGHTNLLLVTINKGIIKKAFYNGIEIVNAPRLLMMNDNFENEQTEEN